MKVHFYLHYGTQFGEAFSLQLSNGASHPMEYLNDELWHLSLKLAPVAFSLHGFLQLATAVAMDHLTSEACEVTR